MHKSVPRPSLPIFRHFLLTFRENHNHSQSDNWRDILQSPITSVFSVPGHTNNIIWFVYINRPVCRVPPATESRNSLAHRVKTLKKQVPTDGSMCDAESCAYGDASSGRRGKRGRRQPRRRWEKTKTSFSGTGALRIRRLGGEKNVASHEERKKRFF